jgi:hypothetical protein
MRRWVANLVIFSLLLATSAHAGDASSADPRRQGSGPFVLQVTGAGLAGLGGVIAIAASGSDEMGADVAVTMGLIGIGLGAALFGVGTLWRSKRSRSSEQSKTQPTATLEFSLIQSAPGLIARAAF